MKPPRPLPLAAVTSLALAGAATLVVPAATAAAGEADPLARHLGPHSGGRRSHVTLDRTAVAAAERRSGTSPEAQRAKAEFLEAQARAGTLWDASEVRAAAAQGVTAAWSSNIVVDQVETAEVVQADGCPGTRFRP